ncbi:MAG: Ig-like domain-containing protein, partial [Roseiflexaceae bacterium]
TTTIPLGAPTGTMTLKDGATALGSCTLTGNLCTLATSTLATGQHAIAAEYSGDAHFNAANSPAVTHVVLIPTYLPLIARL